VEDGEEIQLGNVVMLGMPWAIGIIGALTFLSGVIVAVAMEARPGARQ
jgi:hypothetical protein